MTINPLPPHPKWLRRKLSAVFLWFISRSNDQLFNFVLTPFLQITPQLWIGPQLSERGWRYLNKQHGLNSILNLRVEADDRERGIHADHYLWLPTIDHTSPTVEQLARAARFMQERIEAGDKVYVHCAAGVGRAPLTAAAYFIAQGYSPDEALDLIRSRRPFINQSSNQHTRLRQFAAALKSAEAEKAKDAKAEQKPNPTDEGDLIEKVSQVDEADFVDDVNPVDDETEADELNQTED